MRRAPRAHAAARIKYAAVCFPGPGGKAAAVDFLDGLLRYFATFGPAGELLFLFVVFCLDALLVPTLPELFVMAFFATDPTPVWGLTLLAVVLAAEVTGNGLLYLAIRRFGLPEFVQKKMRKWVGFLLVRDERVILVNRIAPVVPFLGAFIATMKWDLRKSFLYIVVGGAVKYSVLILFVGVFFQVFEKTTARDVTVVAILGLIAVSFIQGQLARKRHFGPVAARVAHLGEPAPDPPAAGPLSDPEKTSNDSPSDKAHRAKAEAENENHKAARRP